MEPNVIIPAPEIKGPKFNFKPLMNPKAIFGIIALILVIAIPLIYLIVFTKFDLSSLLSKSIPALKPPAKTFTIADFKKSMVKDIKTTFATSKDAGVMAYVDLAGQEKNEFQSYQYYVKAFNKMKESYQKLAASMTEPAMTTDDPRVDQKISMIGLKTYASTLKYYKESDFVIPK